MKKAYILLAHRTPQQFGRLIRSLDDGQSEFFVHLDLICDEAPFKLEAGGASNVRFVKRERAGWGKFGFVLAMLNGMRAVIDSGIHFDVVSLISGQDYPLHSNLYMDRFFEQNRDKIFIEHFPFPVEFWFERGMNRIEDYHFGDWRRRSRRKASKLITRICNATIILKRRFPRGLKPYGGWCWWSMPTSAIECILRFVEERPDFVRYHRRSLCPDEMFFQTILLNSKSESIRASLVNNCLRFFDWDNPLSTAPAVLSREYLPALIASKSLFGRKFEMEKDAVVLDRLDAHRADEERRLLEQEASGVVTMDFDRGPDFPNSAASHGTKIGLVGPAAQSSKM